MRADGTDGYDETGSRFLQLFDAYQNTHHEGWNFNSGNYLFTTDTK